MNMKTTKVMPDRCIIVVEKRNKIERVAKKYIYIYLGQTYKRGQQNQMAERRIHMIWAAVRRLNSMLRDGKVPIDLKEIDDERNGNHDTNRNISRQTEINTMCHSSDVGNVLIHELKKKNEGEDVTGRFAQMKWNCVRNETRRENER